ncbi:hypothetical protein STCU_03585 [Strigomonas culicis]|uniref:Uncharacterized protein n=1 Tax=Strigomonas culicis TaxID=28005 RepID=S9VVZ6_9TRYP|nr:hypothetical protein STCU_03585 [Strigomonas culicis]|eukprot:EPY31176.1 hypothetical protein STCU_03585 [Strigomonas culicis]
MHILSFALLSLLLVLFFFFVVVRPCVRFAWHSVDMNEREKAREIEKEAFAISRPVAKVAKKKAKEDATPTTGFTGLLLTDLWREPLYTHSRTSDRLGFIDFGMVVPPIRAFFYCMICPFLCYPIALLHLYGFYRCMQTLVMPKYYRHKRYSDRVTYGVQKREYVEKQKKVLETQVDDLAEIEHALGVTKGQRNQFVDDPERRNVSYYVVEQKIMKAEAIFTGENWAWAFISDSCRYVTPLLFAYLFHPSSKRLMVDLQLVFQRRLRWNQVRHPVLNFFKSYKEYNSSMQRVVLTKAAPKGAQPWSRNL